jgi:hypothetical protein
MYAARRRFVSVLRSWGATDLSSGVVLSVAEHASRARIGEADAMRICSRTTTRRSRRRAEAS